MEKLLLTEACGGKESKNKNKNNLPVCSCLRYNKVDSLIKEKKGKV
jgi:hypothetical protein